MAAPKGNKNHLIHGKAKTRLYYIWKTIKQRCYNPNANSYKNYGAKGITVCDEWLNDFMEFYEWTMANGYKDNLTIDRKDTNGNYEPNNCRWVTQKEQQNNRGNNHLLTYNGETHTIAEWGDITGIKKATIWARIKKGWEVEKALTVKVKAGANTH